MLLRILILGVLAQVGVFATDGRILERGSNGTSVVLLTVASLQQTTVFADDNGMLRRIAYVETRDGTRPNENIWAVGREALQQTQAADHPTLNVKHNLISRELDVDWRAVEWEDLQRPLYSAMAARLLLFLAPERLPDSSDIEGQAAFWKRYYNTNGSVSDFSGAAYELEGNILESYSSEFLLAFGRNDADGINSATLRLFISSIEPDPVLVTVETLRGFNFTGLATNNETLTVEIPNTFQVFSSEERDKGIRVTADGQSSLVVYGLNYDTFTSDAFLALPCDRLAVDQYEYYGVSYGNGNELSHFVIVGCEDDTVLQIGSQFIELDRMETYLWQSFSVTGVRVLSNRPLVVYAGHRCTVIPNHASACDHLTEQVPPTAIWGTNFMSASFAGRSSGDIYRILASQDSTSVSVNCSTSDEVAMYNLTLAGSWQEISTPASSFCFISSNNPLLMMQFGLGNSFDGVGDPFMMMITPVEQYSNNYVFNSLPEFLTNYITIYVTPEDFQPESIFVDDANLEGASWTTVYCSTTTEICGYITYATLTPGEHQLYHTDVSSRIGVSAYGFNSYNSYGYPGGLQLEPVQLATISFSQLEYAAIENDDYARVELVRSGDVSSEVVVLIGSNPYKGSAMARRDYVPIVEIVTFSPRQLTKTVEIQILDDTNVEYDENFFLYLTSGTGVHISPFSRAEVVIINDDGKLFLTPRYGSELGSTLIIITGDKLTADENDNVTCTFDRTKTKGFATKDGTVLCVSPEMSRIGRVPFEIRIEGKDTIFTGISVFISLAHDKASEVVLENEDPFITNGTVLKLRWTPEDIFPLEEASSYTVDVMLREFNSISQKWEVMEVAKDLPNSGYAEVVTPDFKPPGSETDRVDPAVIEIVVNIDTQVRKRAILPILFEIAKYVVRRTVVKYVKKIVEEIPLRIACEAWGLTQSRETIQQLAASLPACPCTEAAISIGDGRRTFYKQEGIAEAVYRYYLHPDSSSCFRQRNPNGPGQQCCYDRDGNIITGPSSGGRIDSVAPVDVKTTIQHLFADVAPYYFCCTPEILQNCGKLYEFRPSDDCSRTRPPRPAFARGDPHLVTLDGLPYTFNGRGEYTLIETTDDRFTLQGRMTLASGVNDGTVAATVFSAIATKDDDSDTVQFEVDENNTLIAIVSGELVVFDLAEQDFEKVTVQQLSSNSIEALFDSGAYVVVGAENGFISILQVILPESFSSEVKGLLGTYNGDTSDDLLPQFGDRSLPSDSSIEDIHNKFGVTWIVDSATKSLFVYQPDKNWDTFYDPYFTPSFEVTFSNTELESRAKEICGDDKSCLFDIAATGNVDIGVATLESTKTIEQIYIFLLPVVCSPACEFGACVANDTCKCSEGYTGKTCSEIVVQTCEENVCKNGGSCTRHVNDYTCDCPHGFSGFLCDEGESDAEETSNTAAIVGVTMMVLALLIASAVLVTVLIVGRSVHRRQYLVKSDGFEKVDLKKLELSVSQKKVTS